MYGGIVGKSVGKYIEGEREREKAEGGRAVENQECHGATWHEKWKEHESKHCERY